MSKDAGSEALGLRVALEVEHLEAHERMAAEALARLGDEQRADVGEGVLDARRRAAAAPRAPSCRRCRAPISRMRSGRPAGRAAAAAIASAIRPL